MFTYKNNNNLNSNIIPKIIHQTYININKVPKKVFENIKKYAPNYEYRFYDNDYCIYFIKKYFDYKIFDAYNKIKLGAHKADLFRYCVLYIYGGIYLDIKTELIQPIENIFNKNYIYSVISIDKKSIYQGIIATPPKNIFFMNLINNFVKIVNTKIDIPYVEFINDFYNEIKKDTKKEITEGENIGTNNNYFLFTEKCTKNKFFCYDKLDRYGLCCYITYNRNNIIKTRYSDFPW